MDALHKLLAILADCDSRMEYNVSTWLEKQASGTNTMLVLGIVFLAVAACLALPGFIAAAAGLLRNFAGN